MPEPTPEPTSAPKPEYVEIFEVGPRDGLQNEPQPIPVSRKIALVDALSRVGFRRIEVASFVSPRWVPQMADSDKVLAGITRAKGVSYVALTPNMRGFEQAVLAQADEIAVFASASEGFSQANLNCSIDESFKRFAPIIKAASVQNMKVRGYVSCVSDCPYDGPTAPQQVAQVAQRLFQAGCYEISLGDTLGRANPERIAAMLNAVLADIPAADLAGHYHDTGNRALENIAISLEMGLRTFDASVGGLGGCPFAPGAAGNVATEAVNAMLVEMGYETGLDADALATAASLAQAMRTADQGGQA